MLMRRSESIIRGFYFPRMLNKESSPLHRDNVAFLLDFDVTR